MSSRSQSGDINVLLLPLIVSVIILVMVAGFGVWAFLGKQDNQNNVDQKVAAAVTTAKKQQGDAKEAEFAERIKEPLKSYTGPAEFGSVSYSYPKTWSAYIDTLGQGDVLANAYFQPDTIPNLSITTTQFALRYQLVDNSYGDVLDQYEGVVTRKLTTVTPYQAVNVPSVIGSRLDGQVNGTKKGIMILLPVRDKTVKIWTESPEAQNDFINFVLPSLRFTP